MIGHHLATARAQLTQLIRLPQHVARPGGHAFDGLFLRGARLLQMLANVVDAFDHRHEFVMQLARTVHDHLDILVAGVDGPQVVDDLQDRHQRAGRQDMDALFGGVQHKIGRKRQRSGERAFDGQEHQHGIDIVEAQPS